MTMAQAAPERSLVQRMEALERANEVRTFRKNTKRDLKAGKVAIQDILLMERGERPAELDEMRVFDLLMHVPKYGRVKVTYLLRDVKIAPSKTIGGMSLRQRTELASMLRR